jgi:hypothetical protein
METVTSAAATGTPPLRGLEDVDGFDDGVDRHAVALEVSAESLLHVVREQADGLVPRRHVADGVCCLDVHDAGDRELEIDSFETVRAVVASRRRKWHDHETRALREFQDVAVHLVDTH